MRSCAVNIVSAMRSRLKATRLSLQIMWFCVPLLTALLIPACDGAAAQVAQTPIPGQSPQLLPNSPDADVALGPVDWVFLVDTSASMSGLAPNAPNIFPLVQATLHDFTAGIQNGDTVTVFEFDTTSRFLLKLQIQNDADRNRVGSLVDGLTARGAWTQTGAALTDALNEVYARGDNERPAAIILLSDGHEDVKGIKNPIRIPAAINLIRDKDVPYVFYVSLGATPDPQLQIFLDRINEKAPDHSLAFNDPRATRLLVEAEKIRTIMRGQRLDLRISPQHLDLGQIPPGGQGGPYSIDISSNKPVTLSLRLMNVAPDHYIEGLPDTLTVEPERVQRVTFTLRLSEGASQSVENYTLRFAPGGLATSPRDVPVKVDVRRSWWEGLLHGLAIVAGWALNHWLILLLIILVLGLAAYLAWKWYSEGSTALDIIRTIIWGNGPPAILTSPEGEIRLNQPLVTLGGDGAKLRDSPASVEIHREGIYHIVKVRQGSVVLIDQLGLSEVRLESGDMQKLKHNDQLMMPGYQSRLKYLNSSRKY
jgi:von Willebrand factor type A domain